MAKIRKEVVVEAEIGQKIKAPKTVFREDLILYINHIEGDLLYISDEIGSSKEQCECSFAEDCYLIE